MNDTLREVAASVARNALRNVERGTVTEQQVLRIVEQDPAKTSWRVWGAVWSVVGGILTIPEVQTGLQAAVGSVVPVAWAPIVPIAMGAVWSIVSKVKDKRPVRS